MDHSKYNSGETRFAGGVSKIELDDISRHFSRGWVQIGLSGFKER